ncbi:type II secretion system protein [Vibrio coralliirubri]|uniref:type II secretion system protein n=1 Tax=Vibrio coralliirubri TaxID=1516159 RepID=UPI002FE21235
MKQAKGFTLIEMIVVIVVLGILAVTAIPKFMDVQSEARVAVLQGVGGALKSANGIVYGQAAIQGLDQEKIEDLEIDEGSITIRMGNLDMDKENILKAMGTDINIFDITDFKVDGADTSAVMFTHKAIQANEKDGKIPFADINDECHLFAYNDPRPSGQGGKVKSQIITELKTDNC